MVPVFCPVCPIPPSPSAIPYSPWNYVRMGAHHTARVFSTRFECIFTSSSLVSSVVLNLFHSFRVWFSGVMLAVGRALSCDQHCGRRDLTCLDAWDDLNDMKKCNEKPANNELKCGDVVKNYTRNEWRTMIHYSGQSSVYF